MRGRVLVVDDDEAMCELVGESLGLRGYEVVWRTTASDALELLADQTFEIFLTDVNLGDANGIELCACVTSRGGDTFAIVMTALPSFKIATDALRAGAHDFVTKPVSMDALAFVVDRAMHYRWLRAELHRVHSRVEMHASPSMLGESAAMRDVHELIGRIATGNATVLITGETGTGKELIARAIHDQSGRKGPFSAINCAALPEGVLESELFGHVRGAFTDASAGRKGMFIEARAGTLFLDEIGDMPLGIQVKILRALQERMVRPVGGSTEFPFDARIIAATNHDLEERVSANRFRSDLYYRINVVGIAVPPLRARGTDTLDLAHYFLAREAARNGKPAKRLGLTAAEALISHDWPGNVRELENCIERAVAVGRYEEVTLSDLPAKIREQKPTNGAASIYATAELTSIRSVETQYIRHVLERVNGNKMAAARILGFDRRTLYRKLSAAVESTADGGTS